MQSNRKHINDCPSTIAVTRHILYNQGFGLNGLNKGLSATIMRNAIFNAFYFGIYNTIIPQLNKQKEYVPELLLKVILHYHITYLVFYKFNKRKLVSFIRNLLSV